MEVCSVEELQEKRARNDRFLLLDVRSSEELAVASLEGACHVPLDEITMRLHELSEWKDDEVICMCHHGMRSAHAQHILENAGFTNVRNLTGGIHAWAVHIDRDMPQY